MGIAFQATLDNCQIKELKLGNKNVRPKLGNICNILLPPPYRAFKVSHYPHRLYIVAAVTYCYGLILLSMVMSCLRLRLMNKLPPARKAWKIFTSKLQKKLTKFHRAPAAVKFTYTTGGNSRQSRPHHRPGKTVPPYNYANAKPRTHLPRRCAFKKKSKPVKIFKETGSSTVAATVNVMSELVGYKNPGVGNFVERPSDGSAAVVAAGTSCGCMEVNEAASAVALGPPDGEDDHDSMWESVGLASPLMQNIDERVEAFISMFRNDMKRQEAMARRQTP
ncbi:hypothetical protein SAY86_028376 [Trapa natans]|uniref:Uncharacterized protein n=1 Tax=Trapa natans TaxID=22666 RepID=A0AAN7LZM4_TRANT|nr:hypothetical protein SAY86_028376 [Trapa natans]